MGAECLVLLLAMTISYDASDFNELTVLLRWRGTIMPSVLCRPVMWLLLAAHMGFLYLHIYRHDVVMPPLPWKLTAVPTSLLTFFLVFYSGNCYTRYYAFYAKCTGMSGAVMCWVGLLRVHFPQASAEKLWNLTRHVVASVYILYFQLAGGASDGGKQVTESEWKVLLQTGLMSAEEKKKLAEYRGFKPFLLQVGGRAAQPAVGRVRIRARCVVGAHRALATAALALQSSHRHSLSFPFLPFRP